MEKLFDVFVKTWLFMLIVLCLFVVYGLGELAFAGTLIKNPDMTYTYQPSPEETMVLEKAEQAFGSEVLLDLIQNWIQDRKQYFVEQEKEDMKKNLDELTEADRQKILQMLRGERMIR